MDYNGKPYPPIYLLVSLAAMTALDRFAPIVTLVDGSLRWLGAGPIVCGLGLAAIAAGAFGRAGTPVVPFQKSTALVTGGVYRFTRNPMYLGMVLALVGAGLALGSLGAFVPVPLFVLVIRQQFILREEAFLETLFGAAYLDYKRRVRRWF